MDFWNNTCWEASEWEDDRDMILADFKNALLEPCGKELRYDTFRSRVKYSRTSGTLRVTVGVGHRGGKIWLIGDNQ